MRMPRESDGLNVPAVRVLGGVYESGDVSDIHDI
jgi:hypothetical protein